MRHYFMKLTQQASIRQIEFFYSLNSKNIYIHSKNNLSLKSYFFQTELEIYLKQGYAVRTTKRPQRYKNVLEQRKKNQ